MSPLIWFYTITKIYLYNFDPLKPHFYIVQLGFTGVYIIFLISAQNIVSRDRTSVGHGDDGLDAITSNQRINTTLCKIKTSMYLKSSKKKKTNYN